MTIPRATVQIVLADDDPEDVELARDALAEVRLANNLQVVGDGDELLELLRGTGHHAGHPAHPRLILLDLKMPRMDGFEVLRQLKGDAALRTIPVVVLTTSAADADIVRSYDLGVNSFITKPVTFEGLVAAMRAVGHYWFEIVELPGRDAGAR